MYPIQVVSRRTGISQNTLRAWERRYASVRPERNGRGRRLYSEALLRRLSMCADLVAHGYRIGDIVDLVDEELARRHELAQPAHTEPSGSALLGQRLVDAARRFDGAYLHSLMNDAILSYGRLGLVDGFVFPFEDQIRQAVEQGELHDIHWSWLHMELFRLLGSFLPSVDADAERPTVIIASPGSTSHELGLAGSAIHADAAGWSAIAVGSVPAEQIAAAVGSTGARAVVLVVVTWVYDVALRDELKRTATLIGSTAPILFGGRMPDAFRDDLSREGLRYVPHMKALQDELLRVRYGSVLP